MKKIHFLLIVFSGLAISQSVKGQTHMSTYDDATTGIAGFSYDISISYKLIKPWSKARPSEVYSVKLVHVVPSSRGFFYSRSKKQYYSCSELGSACNPDNWRQVMVDLTGRCKSAAKDRISFSRVNEEKTIEHWVEEGGNCIFDGLEGNVIQESSALIKIIDAKEGGGATGSSSGISNSSGSSASSSSSENPESKKPNTSTVPEQIPDSYKGNPMLYNRLIPSGSTNKFTQNMENVSTILTAATPMLEQWAANRQKKQEAATKKYEEDEKRRVLEKEKKQEEDKIFKQNQFKTLYLDKYMSQAEKGDENARMILYYSSDALWSAEYVPQRKVWFAQALANNNLEAMVESALEIMKTDENEGLDILTNAARRGNTDAMMILASYYDLKTANKKNIAKGIINDSLALYWYMEASRMCSPNGMYMMGMINRYGIDAPKKGKSNAKYYMLGVVGVASMLAEKNDNDKHIKKYYAKYRVPRNDSLAFTFFSKSVNTPFERSLFNRQNSGQGSRFEKAAYKEIAAMYQKGYGVEKNKDRVKEFEKLYATYKEPEDF